MLVLPRVKVSYILYFVEFIEAMVYQVDVIHT